MPPKQLPINSTDRTRVLMNLGDEIRNVAVDTSLVDIAVEDAVPVREFYAWKHKRNYEGYWYSTTTDTHLRFESLLEKQFLLSADHDPSIVSISAQPLAALWPANTRTNEGKKLRSHVPDFFCRYANGDGGLVDVRRPDKADDPHFILTRILCNTIGWRYTVFTGLKSPQAETLEWLAGYRMDRYSPAPDVADNIVDTFSSENSLRAAVQAIARRTAHPPAVILASILHLLFHGRLSYDPRLPMNMEAIIRSGKEAAT